MATSQPFNRCRPFSLRSKFQRAQAEQQLHNALQTQSFAWLGGQEGIGKTWLANQFAHTYEAAYGHILWFNCAHNLEAQYRTMTVQCDLAGIEPLQELQQMLRECQHTSLLIYDNAESGTPNLLADDRHIRKHVVLISKATKQPDVLLGPLAPEEGAQLIMLCAGRNPTSVSAKELQAASAVSEHFHGVPFWLTKAGQYIETSSPTITELWAQLLGRDHDEIVEAVKNTKLYE